MGKASPVRIKPATGLGERAGAAPGSSQGGDNGAPAAAAPGPKLGAAPSGAAGSPAGQLSWAASLPFFPAYTGGRDSCLQNQTWGGGEDDRRGEQNKKKSQRRNPGPPGGRSGTSAAPSCGMGSSAGRCRRGAGAGPGLSEPLQPVPALSGSLGRAQQAGGISSQAGSRGAGRGQPEGRGRVSCLGTGWKMVHEGWLWEWALALGCIPADPTDRVSPSLFLSFFPPHPSPRHACPLLRLLRPSTPLSWLRVP